MDLEISEALPFSFQAQVDFPDQPKVQYFGKFHSERDSPLFPIEIQSAQSIISQGKPVPEENVFTISEEPPIIEPFEIILSNGKARKSEGCRCTKTGCRKGYCSCLQNGVKCGPSCGCKNCGNHHFRAHYCGKMDYNMSFSNFNAKSKVVL